MEAIEFGKQIGGFNRSAESESHCGRSLIGSSVLRMFGHAHTRLTIQSQTAMISRRNGVTCGLRWQWRREHFPEAVQHLDDASSRLGTTVNLYLKVFIGWTCSGDVRRIIGRCSRLYLLYPSIPSDRRLYTHTSWGFGKKKTINHGSVFFCRTGSWWGRL